MAKAYPPEELGRRAFWITMALVIAWIGSSFAFVILQR